MNDFLLLYLNQILNEKYNHVEGVESFFFSLGDNQNGFKRKKNFCSQSFAFAEAGLVQSVERLTAEREVADSIPGAGTILGVTK